jgi:heptaprenyl diphosphate synthase
MDTAATRSVGFIDGVERRLADVVGAEVRLERAAARLVLASGAKRARARVCRSLAEELGVDDAVTTEIAAIVELIHGASLLHDDVVDHSERRRGLPTVNATDGNAFAVLCGDLVLARALHLVAALPHGGAMVVDAIDVVERMTRAAVIEVEARTTLPEPRAGLALWREMALGKTGALFGLCGSLIARAAGVDDAARDALRRGLEALGVAFQLIDDLGDVAGTDAGKPRGQDVREHALNHTLLSAMCVDGALALACQSAWRQGGELDGAVVDDLCDRALGAGGAGTVAEARAAVQDGAAAGAAALAREVLPWARRLVADATGVVVPVEPERRSVGA